MRVLTVPCVWPPSTAAGAPLFLRRLCRPWHPSSPPAWMGIPENINTIFFTYTDLLEWPPLKGDHPRANGHRLFYIKSLLYCFVARGNTRTLWNNTFVTSFIGTGFTVLSLGLKCNSMQHNWNMLGNTVFLVLESIIFIFYILKNILKSYYV